MTGSIYQSDPAAAPDSDYVPGELRHLVPGNRGRLLDPRRTPMHVTAVRPATGDFELEVDAFEDAGARWVLPLADVARFQFEPGGAVARASELAALEQARVRFDRPLRVPADASIRPRTLARLDAERARARAWLAGRGPSLHLDVGALIERRTGSEALFELAEAYLGERGLREQDAALSAVFVSNPASGELVKGHAIVAAELGLWPYAGQAVRDPAALAGAWGRAQRAEHLLARMGFTQAVWAALGHEELTLYRGAAAEGPLRERAPATFVSATFSRAVAQEHFTGSPVTRAAVLWRVRVELERLFMSFLETRAFNERFREAEALLVGEPFTTS
ncbi:MAG TPA: hypothetical protein VE992_05905 [Solirubrobacteraceae bacterium]|nr:hypothetical protein [Solirubrobacteraceae bacterium]